MKKLLIASTMLVSLSVTAFAADLRTSPSAIPAVAQMAVGNWTGFYAGAHAGWLGSSHNTFVGDFGGAAIGGTDAIIASYSRSGFNGGLYGGLNVQMQQLVLGLEADIGFGPGAKVTSPSLPFSNSNGGAANAGGVRDGLNWNGHVRTRVGFAMGQFMPFIAAGLAFGEQRIGNVVTPATTAGATLFSTRNIMRYGYSLGAGAEFMFTRNLIGRVEYLFDDYGSSRFGIDVDQASALNGITGNARTRLTSSTVRAGIGYKF